MAVALSVSGMAVFAGQAKAVSLVTGTYELDWDQDVEKTDAGTTDTRKLKQTLELKFRGFLTPIVENEISFKVEQEINSNTADTTRFLPVADLGFRGRYWEAKAGAKRTHENSDEPGRNPNITDSYYVELFYVAPPNVPDLKGKYTIDKDFEEGKTDTLKKGITLSSVYKPTAWLDMKGDYTRDTGEDGLNPDSDTKEQTRSASMAIRHMFTEKIRFDVQYAFKETRGATYLDAGGETNKKDEVTHTETSSLSFRPFEATTLDGNYDYELKQDMVTGEHTLTTNGKATLSQKIGEPYEVKGEFSRKIVEIRHSLDDNKDTEDTVTVELKAKLSKKSDLTLKYQDKDTVEDHFDDPSKSTTSGSTNRNASYNAQLTTFFKAYASYDRTDTIEDEIKTVVDTKYSLKGLLDFKALKLTMEPTYEISEKEDFVKPEESETRDFRFKVAWTAISTKYVEAKAEHTYGRKTDSALHNIERTDNSTGNVTLKDSIPGLTFAVDVTRVATDTSGDDLLPDINSTFGFKADYLHEWMAFNMSYKYDKKSLTDDSETFDAKATWTATRWEASLSYSFNKTFSVELNERYSIGLSFKYNL